MNTEEAAAAVLAALDAGEVLVIEDYDVMAGMLAVPGDTSPPMVFLTVDGAHGGDARDKRRQFLVIELGDAETFARHILTAVRETRARTRARDN